MGRGCARGGVRELCGAGRKALEWLARKYAPAERAHLSERRELGEGEGAEDGAVAVEQPAVVEDVALPLGGQPAPLPREEGHVARILTGRVVDVSHGGGLARRLPRRVQCL